MKIEISRVYTKKKVLAGYECIIIITNIIYYYKFL